MAEPRPIANAVALTDDFYRNSGGFSYSEEKATRWVSHNVDVPRTGRVLDLCCGNGIWSVAMRNIAPDIELCGIDISQGAIEHARSLLPEGDFRVGDAEQALPWPDEQFDLIFARGPGLYNQHSMECAATIEVLEAWHEKLAPSGRFYSIFYSMPERMGSYGPIGNAKLPMNWTPRRTDAVEFLGGKFHHSIRSFVAPFEMSPKITILTYRFEAKMHVMVSARAELLSDPES